MLRIASLAVLLVAGSTAIGIHAQPAARRTEPAAGNGLIVGQVVDAVSGKPISGALVMLAGPPVRSPSGVIEQGRVMTGADGYFVFRHLSRGNYRINAMRGGYVEGAYGRRRPSGPPQPLDLADGERVGDVIVRMWRHAAIAGTVTDEAGEPLVAVQVRAFRRTTLGGRPRFVGSLNGTSDDRGMYRIGGLPPGDYLIAATTRHVALPAAVARRFDNAHLSPEIVRTFGRGGGSDGTIEVADFVYRLGNGAPVPPPPRTGRLFVYPPTFYPSSAAPGSASVITAASGEERVAVDLNLQPVPTVTVSGVVGGFDPSGPQVILRLVPAAADEVAIEQDAPAAIIDQNGEFAFGAVVPGEYTLRGATDRAGIRPEMAVTAATPWVDLPLTVGERDLTSIAVALNPGLCIRGRFEFEGSRQRPQGSQLQQVSIVIERADATAGRELFAAPARADASGQFMSGGVPAGRYFVRVGGSPVGWMFKSATYGGRDVAESPLELRTGDADGVIITFTDRWTNLRGIVRNAQGAADPDAIVLVFTTDPQMWREFGTAPRRLRSARPGRAGNYAFPSLPPGTYYVVAIPDEHAADWQDAAFLQTLSRMAVTVTLVEGDSKVQDLRTREVR